MKFSFQIYDYIDDDGLACPYTNLVKKSEDNCYVSNFILIFTILKHLIWQ